MGSEAAENARKGDLKDYRIKFCIRFKVTTGITIIAVYVKIRAVVLLLDSFVPPLLKKEKEKSWRYPEGATLYSTYFENETLITLYVINIIFCFFLLCYGIATYYTWIVSLSDLYVGRLDKLIYQKMP